MSFWNGGSILGELSKRTPIFGLRAWMLIGICIGAAILLVLCLLCLCLTCRRRRRSSLSSVDAAEAHKQKAKPLKLHLQDSTPLVSKDITDIFHPPPSAAVASDVAEAGTGTAARDVRIDIGKPDHRVVLADKQQQQHRAPPAMPPSEPVPPSASSTGTASGGANSGAQSSSVGGSGHGAGLPEVSHLGWGHWYTLRELKEATGRFAEENIIGEGANGVVYRGVLPDSTFVAIKNLINTRGQAEKEFKDEVEAIGRVRHKNLVKLLGYCIEGAYRMLVYEYLDNGNLDQWLHGDVGEVSPLYWDIRMNIIIGAARGLAYLHEGLEPKVVHRDVKSSNILLDQQWNAKVSDFGLAKLLGSDRSHVTTRVMGTFGYVAPDYACTGMLTERSDIYSFGILIMEVISGRAPVDYRRPHGEENLMEWFKNMVGDRKYELVVDPKMPGKPSPKALTRAILVAIRCVDPAAHKRPNMGHVIHMLEMEDLLGRDDRKFIREAPTAASSENYHEEGQSSDMHDYRSRQ